MAGAFQVRAGRLLQVLLVSMSERKSPAQLPEPRLVRTGRSTEASIGNVVIDVCIVCQVENIEKFAHPRRGRKELGSGYHSTCNLFLWITSVLFTAEKLVEYRVK